MIRTDVLETELAETRQQMVEVLNRLQSLEFNEQTLEDMDPDTANIETYDARFCADYSATAATVIGTVGYSTIDVVGIFEDDPYSEAGGVVTISSDTNTDGSRFGVVGSVTYKLELSAATQSANITVSSRLTAGGAQSNQQESAYLSTTSTTVGYINIAHTRIQEGSGNVSLSAIFTSTNAATVEAINADLSIHQIEES